MLMVVSRSRVGTGYIDVFKVVGCYDWGVDFGCSGEFLFPLLLVCVCVICGW